MFKKRTVCRFAVYFGAVLLLGNRVAQSAPDARSSAIRELANGVALSSGTSTLEVQILEERVARVYVRVDEKATARTLVLDPHPVLHSPGKVLTSTDNGIYTLATPYLKVEISERAPNRIVFRDGRGQILLQSEDPVGEAMRGGLTLIHAEGESLFGMRGLPKEDSGAGLMRNGGAKIVAGIQGDSGAPLTFTTHYGVLVDSDGGEFVTSGKSFSYMHDSRPDVEYFVAAGAPLQTMAAFSRLVGPPPLPPRWTLGFLNSQWGTDQKEVERIVETYRAKHLPIDGFILDFDWKAWGEDDYGEWRWNSSSGAGAVAPNKFPDGASGQFAQELAAKGVRLCGILKPRILVTTADGSGRPTAAAAYATAHDLWYPNETLEKDYVTHREARNLDFSKAETRKWFWEHLEPAFQSGLAAWWNDEADYTRSVVFNNFQFLNMSRALFDGQRSISSKRVWSINRSFYIGASRYGAAGWSGDIRTGFDSMAYQRRRMLAALNTGEFHWSMDTGGFFGHPSSENYARWMEFAAFVPIMRVHGNLNEKRQPWVYGTAAEAAAKHSIELRYSLLPYIYSYEQRSAGGEIGLVRPLLWEFPDDAKAAMLDSEWMFGDALLVSPVVAEGATTQHVYLPAGTWFDYASGKSYAGEQSIDLPVNSTTWSDIPLFVRAGSIVATQPVQQYVGESPVRTITLDIFPTGEESCFTVYDDDGETYAYEHGAYLRQAIHAKSIGDHVSIVVDGATGNYASNLREYLVRVHAPAHTVSVDRRKLIEANGDNPGAVGERWSEGRDQFGVVTTLKIVAGENKQTKIELRK